jgi:hypothetical protein
VLSGEPGFTSSEEQSHMSERKNEIGRRSFLLSAGSLAAMPLVGGLATQALGQAATGNPGEEQWRVF